MNETHTRIEQFLAECESQNHENERLSIGFVRACLEDDDEDALGLLVLAVAVANMGVAIPIPIPIVDDPDHVVMAYDFPDPVGTKWAGRPRGAGKHVTDHRKGGLLLPHIDGSSLLEVYAKWGGPCLPVNAPTTDFNRIIRSRWSEKWLSWARELASRREVLVWSVEWWLQKYWHHRLVTPCKDPIARIMRTRIANSRPGWLRDIPPTHNFQQHAREYTQRKYQEGLRSSEERAARKAQRAERQILNCLRLVILVQNLGGAK